MLRFSPKRSVMGKCPSQPKPNTNTSEIVVTGSVNSRQPPKRSNIRKLRKRDLLYATWLAVKPSFKHWKSADRLGQDAFLKKYGFKPSREYVLTYEGKKYDSKAIAGAAFQFLYPGARPLLHSELNGGRKGAAGHLARLGFQVDQIAVDPKDWSYAEVAATVEDYFEMLGDVLAGRSINKSKHNELLRERLNNRSTASVELKHQNISAILDRQGLMWLTGYAPRGNVQLLLRAVVNDWVSDRPEMFMSLPPDTHKAPPSMLPLVAPPTAKAFRETQRERRGIKVDFGERDARNRQLGQAGEQWLLTILKANLLKLGRPDLADAVRWVSQEKGDGLGYDIEAYDSEARPLYIEVKTTNGGIAAPFLVTANEVAVSKEEADHYAIYRVFDFAKEPKVYVLKGPVDVSCELTPHLWRAFPK